MIKYLVAVGVAFQYVWGNPALATRTSGSDGDLSPSNRNPSEPSSTYQAIATMDPRLGSRPPVVDRPLQGGTCSTRCIPTNCDSRYNSDSTSGSQKHSWTEA